MLKCFQLALPQPQAFFFSMGMCNSNPAVATASELKSKSCKSYLHKRAVILLKFMDFTESKGGGLHPKWEVWTLISGSHTAHVTTYRQVTLGWDWRQCLETVLVLRQQNNVPETKPLPALYLSYISVSTLSVSDVSDQWSTVENTY